jgi:hypothetical protein
MSGPTTPEGKIKEGIAFYLSLLRKRGALDFWYNHSSGAYDANWTHFDKKTNKMVKGGFRRRNSTYDRNGVSDIVGFLKGGRALFIEVKSKTGQLTDNQKLFRESCERFGALFILARSVSDVQAALIPHLQDIDSL